MKNVIVSKNARIIFQVEYVNGQTGMKYLIRDKNRPEDVPVDFYNILRITTEEVEKFKGSINKETSTTTLLGNGTYEVNQGDAEKFSISGSLTSLRRLVISKEFPEMRLELTSSSLSGNGTYSTKNEIGNFVPRYATGIIKASVPKVISTR